MSLDSEEECWKKMMKRLLAGHVVYAGDPKWQSAGLLSKREVQLFLQNKRGNGKMSSYIYLWACTKAALMLAKMSARGVRCCEAEKWIEDIRRLLDELDMLRRAGRAWQAYMLVRRKLGDPFA